MKLNTEHLNRCIQTLEGAIDKLNASVEGSIEYDIFRNASIKGFELTLETSGKLLKESLIKSNNFTLAKSAAIFPEDRINRITIHAHFMKHSDTFFSV